MTEPPLLLEPSKDPGLYAQKLVSLGLKQLNLIVLPLLLPREAKAVPPPSHDPVQYNKRTTNSSASDGNGLTLFDFADGKHLTVDVALITASISRQTFWR